MALALAAPGAWPEGSPLSVRVLVGTQSYAGTDAKTDADPFAAVLTTTKLTTSARPPLLLTETVLVQAPGSEFKLGPGAKLAALRFTGGLAIPLRASWNFSLWLEGGLQAALNTGPGTVPRWLALGVRVASTARGSLRISAAVDQRGGAWRPAVLVAGEFDLVQGFPAVTLVSSARIGSGSTRVEVGLGVGR